MTTTRALCSFYRTMLIVAISAIAASVTTAEASTCYNSSYSHSPTNDYDGTLHISSAKGAFETVEKLLNAGLDPNNVNSFGYFPLHVAAFAGHTAIVEALLNAGADPNIVPAVSSDSDRALNYCAGMTPLHFAAAAGHTELVDLLLTAGADVSSVAGNGYTPIYWADKAGHVSAVISLLNAGATQ